MKKTEHSATIQLTYQYVWSLMDRIIVVTGAALFLMCIATAFGLRYSSSVWVLAAVLAIILALLLWLRQKLFSPNKVFQRLLDLVEYATLDQSKLENWPLWRKTITIKSFADFYTSSITALDSIGDFYTCLLSPEIASKVPKGKPLSDFGLWFGIQRTTEGLLVFDENGNLLPVLNTNGLPRIESIIFNSAASNAGLRPADAVISIDGRSSINVPLAGIYRTNHVREEVVIEYERGTQRRVTTVNLRRTVPKIVAAFLPDNVGYLRIETFERLRINELSKKLQQLARCSGIILDLRGNRGGDIRNALILLSAFISKGTVAHVQRRLNNRLYKMRYVLGEQFIETEVDSDNSNVYIPMGSSDNLKRVPDSLANTPLAVLIDSYSMSGAELVAGALQDFQRGTILGIKSFGKGIGQDVFGIPPCVKVSVTSMKFTTPSGTWPGDGAITIANGIVPDQELQPSSDTVFGDPHDSWLKSAAACLSVAIDANA